MIYIKFKNLEKLGVKHEIFMNDFNFRITNIDSYIESINRAKKFLDINNVYKACQTHSDNILILTSSNKEKYNACNINKEEYDAYITNEKDIPILVTMADCNNIVIYDNVKKVLAVIHSGWKGTVLKITSKTLNKMIEVFDCDVKDVNVFVGPSIRKCCFTTEDVTFKNMFEEKYVKEANNIYHIDLVSIIKDDLLKANVQNDKIEIINMCTKCNTNICHSYRDCTNKNLKEYKTMGIICLL